MATPSVEREQTDQETPRTVPETQRDLVRRLLGEVSEMRKENQQLQSEVATLKANVTKRRLFRQPKDNDAECSNAIRKVYQEFKKDQQENEENQQVFDLKARFGFVNRFLVSCFSFDSPGNQAVAKRVLCEVRSLYGKGKWKKAVIRDAVGKHWRSIRDDETRKAKGKFEEHRRQAKRGNRLKRKLSRRLSSLENNTALSEGDKVKAREILSSPNAVDYMSSEESDPGDTTEERSRGPKARKIKKLSWERSKLKNIKEILDECYLSGLNAKQRRTSARVSRCEEVSPRPCPVDGPRWAVRSQ
ncbi:uncharacterized protein [Porites lutea]|uniref:uncharacterized protein n=1 Tax=Porites lutea TaxID=51062 RepID=UPI003CC66DA1